MVTICCDAGFYAENIPQCCDTVHWVWIFVHQHTYVVKYFLFHLLISWGKTMGFLVSSIMESKWLAIVMDILETVCRLHNIEALR